MKTLKKIINGILVVVLLLSMAGCASGEENVSESKESGGFQVGYGEADITPEESIPLQGSGNVLASMSNGFEERLSVCCFVVKDEKGEMAMIIVYDLCVMGDSNITSIRSDVSKDTGVKKENIIVSTTHNHGGPDITEIGVAAISRYLSHLYDRTVDAAVAAVEDLAPAEMMTTSVQTENLTFVRRYVLENGTYAGSNYGHFGSAPIKEHEAGLDEEMQLIKFVREDKDDIILTNFQAHAASILPTNSASADFVGIYRNTVSEKLGCHVLYIQGASGNLNPMSKIESENVAKNYIEHGKLLAEYTIKAEGSYKKANTGDVKIKSVTYAAEINHAYDALVAEATQIRNYWRSSGNKTKADEMCEGTDISSANHAQAICAIAAFGAKIDTQLTVLSIGNTAFATAPFELFGQLGLMIKEKSPYDMTFVMAYTNGSYGYLPSEDVWDHRGYEVDVCKLPKGGGEALVGQLINMLDQMKSGK